MTDNETRSLTAHFPSYPTARHFLRILEGVSETLYRQMTGQIWEQRGNPQAQVEWSNPDDWIADRRSVDYIEFDDRKLIQFESEEIDETE